eukprot:scaffold549397_cov45-Prasinocladus_malaysianus.AAC.1
MPICALNHLHNALALLGAGRWLPYLGHIAEDALVPKGHAGPDEPERLCGRVDAHEGARQDVVKVGRSLLAVQDCRVGLEEL